MAIGRIGLRERIGKKVHNLYKCMSKSYIIDPKLSDLSMVRMKLK